MSLISRSTNGTPSSSAQARRKIGFLTLLTLAVLALVGPATLAARATPAARAAPAGGPGWRWPLTPRPRVLRGFAPPAHRWQAGHRGVDLVGRTGQRVLAAGGGTVAFAGMLAGRGVLVIKHGLVRTTYEPVLATVPVGARVSAGQPVGLLVGSSGHCHLGVSCLHWGLLRGRAYLDPLILVWGGAARLLPLAATPASTTPA